MRKIRINEWELLLMVTFIQAVYIFFWASHVRSWADLSADELHRVQPLVLWFIHLSFWDQQIHLWIVQWILFSTERSWLDAIHVSMPIHSE
jgi:hypothetical protein